MTMMHNPASPGELLREFLVGDFVLGNVLHGVLGTDPNIDLRSDDGDVAESVDQILVHVPFQILFREDVMPLWPEVGKKG